MYAFKLESVSSYFVIGVCAEETDLFSNSPFCCDKLRVGYFVNSMDVLITTKGKSKSVKAKKLNKNERLAIYVHPGSYDLNGLVQVSFYHSVNETDFEYQFSIKNIPLSKNGKLFSFFGCSSSNVELSMDPCKFNSTYYQNPLKCYDFLYL